MRREVWRCLVLAAAAAGFAAGCTSPQEPEPSGGPSVTASPDATQDAPIPTSTPPGSVIDVDTPPGSADDGFVGARDDVELERCELDAGAWVVEGSVTNGQADAQTYRVYVALLDADQTVALKEVVVADVAPGGTQQWAAAIEVAGDALQCVLRVERTET